MRELVKRTAAILLSAAVIFAFTPFVGGTQEAYAQDDRTEIYSVTMTSNLSDVFVYGQPVRYPEFDSEEGNPVYGAMSNWQKKEDGAWVTYDGYDVFTPGVWRVQTQIRIDEEAGTLYKLGDPFTATVDGVPWTVDPDPYIDEDFSYNWMTSPEMIVEEPDELTVRDSPEYDIPVNYVGSAITMFSVAGCAEGGVKPYSFEKVSGPAWITVDSAGNVNGTPWEIGPNEDLVIRVTDKVGAQKDLTVSVGNTAISPEDRTDVCSAGFTTDIGIAPAVDEDITYPAFTPEEGSVADVSMSAWEKKIGGIWEPVYTGTFTPGTWRYKAQIYIGGKNGTLYKLADPFAVTVDGMAWMADPDGVSVFDTSSWIWAFSHEILIQREISKAVIGGITDKTYTGSAVTQTPTVTYNGEELVKNTDYTLSYKNNTNAGTATVTITGIGNYKGSVSRTFKINAKAVTPTVTLSKSAFTYNGKIQKPAVTVKVGSRKLTTADYTLTNPGRKGVGKGTVKVTLKRNYKGTKSVTYKINPKGKSLSSVTAGSKSFTAKWTKQAAKMSTSYISGYQIQYATDSKFTKNMKKVTVPKYSTTSKKITKLAGGKKYYVRLRTYKKVGTVTYYSPWSAYKTVTTKK